MAIVQPPTYIAGGCYTAQQFRALQSSAAGQVPNVVTGITLTGVSGRDLTFSTGHAVVEGVTATEGYYQVLVSTPETVTVGPGSVSPRIDRIVVRVQTTEFGDASNLGSIQVVAGTPDPVSPVAPTPTFSRYLTLATVYVPAGATSLTTSNVTELQINNRNISVCKSGGRPGSPSKGLPIYETDTNRFLTYQTATTGWTPPWNMPWGTVFSGRATVNVAVSANVLTPLIPSSNVQLVANRRYRMVGVRGFNSNVTGYNYLYINQLSPSSSQVAQATTRHTLGTIDFTTTVVQGDFTPASSGTYSFRLDFLSQNAGTIDTVSTTCLFTIDDVGPVSAPL